MGNKTAWGTTVKSVKAALLGATFLVGASAAASAADIYAGGGGLKDEPVYMPAITWTGFYVGANVGSTFDDSVNVEFLSYPVGTIDLDNSLVAGVQIGYNWQMPSNIVVGFEGDIGIQNDELDLGFDTLDITSYLASIRARLGYAWGNALIYGTAGVAFRGYSDDISDFLEDDPAVGWVAGGGVDYKLASNVSVGVEALYYNFENSTFFDIVDLERETWAVRARLNYHFTSPYSEPLK